jgi:hypothetical protein
MITIKESSKPKIKVVSDLDRGDTFFFIEGTKATLYMRIDPNYQIDGYKLQGKVTIVNISNGVLHTISEDTQVIPFTGELVVS